MDEFMVGAICSMCNMGVHFLAGRVACDGCDLPTDCCRCQVIEAGPRPRAALGRGTLALPPGSDDESTYRRRR